MRPGGAPCPADADLAAFGGSRRRRLDARDDAVLHEHQRAARETALTVEGDVCPVFVHGASRGW
jgi:hypothetical protein